MLMQWHYNRIVTHLPSLWSCGVLRVVKVWMHNREDHFRAITVDVATTQALRRTDEAPSQHSLPKCEEYSVRLTIRSLPPAAAAAERSDGADASDTEDGDSGAKTHIDSNMCSVITEELPDLYRLVIAVPDAAFLRCGRPALPTTDSREAGPACPLTSKPTTHTTPTRTRDRAELDRVCAGSES